MRRPFDHPDGFVTFDVACEYVLNFHGEPASDGTQGLWLPPGDFVRKLLEAAFHADAENLCRLGLGFPNLMSAVGLWRALGPAQLVAIVESAREVKP